ncbi:MAG: hypothetical protein GY881_03105 [Gammaproteobacteria bacterium]|nr:hypothetical protein [Gammaproteobacteria bacterium]
MVEASPSADTSPVTVNSQAKAIIKKAEKSAKVPVTLVPQTGVLPTDRVELWLAQAEIAMRRDHLTTPASNNAYAFYIRVLMQDETNQKAMQGLERIVQRYLQLAKNSHKKGKRKQVQLFLNRANKVVPGHQEVAQIKRQLAKSKPPQATKKSAPKVTKKTKKITQVVKYKPIQSQAQSVLDAPEGMQRQRILIPTDALQNEAPALAIYLRSLARQVEQVDGRLYIIAPKDKQIRWVYGLLNGTNPNYRIRANIKHKSPAAVEIMYQSQEPILDVFH